MTQGATEQITVSEKNTACSSVVGFGTVVFLSAVAAAVIFKRNNATDAFN